MPDGFPHVPYNDLQAMREAVTDKTVAIMLEPVLAKPGSIPPPGSTSRACASCATSRACS